MPITDHDCPFCDEPVHTDGLLDNYHQLGCGATLPKAWCTAAWHDELSDQTHAIVDVQTNALLALYDDREAANDARKDFNEVKDRPLQVLSPEEWADRVEEKEAEDDLVVERDS